MHNLVFVLFQFEVRNLEHSYSLQRQDECIVGVVPTVLFSQVLPHLSQRTENPRPIKPLTLTVFAVIRHRISTSDRVSRINTPATLEEAF